MNTKISSLIFCVEAIMYLLLYNLYDCTLNVIRNKLNNMAIHDEMFIIVIVTVK